MKEYIIPSNISGAYALKQLMKLSQGLKIKLTLRKDGSNFVVRVKGEEVLIFDRLIETWLNSNKRRDQ